MATKEAVFNVKVNTGNSVKDVQDLDMSLNNVNKTLDSTSQSMDKNATFAQRYGDELQPLTTRLGEAEDRLYELALAGQQASQEYQELLETVTRYRQTQIAVDQTVDASAQTMGQKLVANVEFGASAFQAYESAVALAGVESEALVQTMVKLQAIQGLVGSIQGLSQGLKESTIGMKALALAQGLYSTVVGTSTGLMKAFRIALLSTGIGALVVAVGVLIANFDKLTYVFKPVINGLKAIGDAIGLTDFAAEEASKNEERRAELQRQRNEMTLWNLEREHRARQRYIRENTRNHNDEQKQYDRIIAAQNAEGKSSIKWTKAKIQASIDYQKYLLKEQELELRNAEAKLKTVTGEEYRKVEDQIESQKNALNQIKNNILDSENELKLIDINARKQASSRARASSDERKRRKEKELEEEKKRIFNLQKLEMEFLEELEKLDEEAYQKTLTAQQKEETAINDKYFRLIETAKQYGMDTTDLEAKQQLELAGIRKKYDDEAIAKAKEKEQKILEIREKFNALFRDQFDQQIADARKSNQEQINELEKANKEGIISDGEFYIAKLKLANDLADKEKQIEKEKNEYIKQQNIKAREEQLKGIQSIIDGAQKGLEGLSQINNLVNQIDQARLNSIQSRRDENLESLDANLEAQLEREDLTADQKKAIEENFAEQKFKVQQKAFEEEEKIKRAQFNRDKALKLAQVSIDTASAIVKAIAQFGPPPSPLGIAGIASAGVIGLTQALAILNQQYQGGTAPSPPQIGGASAGSLTGAGASTFTANTSAQQTDLTTLGQENVPVSQVVVLESDITGTQSKVAVQEAKSSF